MKTIRVQLQGGLGNQLFIWAMAHEITLSTGRRVQLDYIRDRYQRKDRPIEIERLLDVCQHDISINETTLMGNLFRFIDKIGSYSKFSQNLLSGIMRMYDCKTSYEIPDISKRNPKIIRGYFQSIEMVERNHEVLEKEIKSILEREQVANKVNTNLVLHIRRGDTREISKNWGVLSLNYYLNQVDTSAPLTISLDDTKEVEVLAQHFPHATFLTPDNSTTWQTLKILAESKTLIIANSTLSWWGAWIKSVANPETVYFPDSWRPADPKTIENLRISSAYFVKSEFEV
jgi:hypothetical protein